MSDRNPYQRLLYEHLAEHGVELVGHGALTPAWLESHRDSVDLLHVHWRLDRLVDDDEPLGPPREWTPDAAAEAADRLGHQLAHARDLGYTIAWTVHEIGRLGGVEPSLHHLAAVELGRRSHIVMTHDLVSSARVLDLELAPPERVRTIPLGHYGDAHGPGEDLRREDLGIDDATTVFLAFGHQRPDKALDVLLDAFGQLARRDVVLLIAGAQQVEDDGSPAVGPDPDDDRIVRWGHVPDSQVAPLHRLADATVIARGYEWTPSSLVLSLSHSCPVIAADIASVNEHGGPGLFVFHPGDAADLAATMARVADDPDERRIRGAAGAAFVRSATWEDTARATADAFADGMAHTARRSDDA
ncbi:glycosyltransferase [Aquihabitans daechungensis]|uniref:glycosyltransferase n=1 Tax=Aquihabitans daechungensis TaxID=1052257 RepID=UPI003BA0A420